MMFRVTVVTAILLGGLLSGGPAAVAGAEPDGALCNFTLSDPYVTDVSGTPMVAATLTPGACTGTAHPTSSQACLSAPGIAGRCAELPGFNSAHVYLGPYRAGVTYTARGRGCGMQTNPPAAICTTVGPRSATL